MKIRRIDNHSVVVEEVEECTTEPNRSFYIGAKRYNERDGTSTLYARSKWELVPEERWAPAHVTVRDNRRIVVRHRMSELGSYEIMFQNAPLHLRVRNLGGGIVKFEECVS